MAVNLRAIRRSGGHLSLDKRITSGRRGGGDEPSAMGLCLSSPGVTLEDKMLRGVTGSLCSGRGPELLIW